MICCGAQERGFVKLYVIIPLAALFSLGTAARLPAQSSETSIDKKIDAVFSGVTSPDAPGLAALVRKNSRTVFERAYGVRPQCRRFHTIQGDNELLGTVLRERKGHRHPVKTTSSRKDGLSEADVGWVE